MRTKHTFRLPPEFAKQLADYAGRKRLHQAFVVETALASFLSPDNFERMEAALGKRLDRLTWNTGGRAGSIMPPIE
jgi:predicted transcriptional regulator